MMPPFVVAAAVLGLLLEEEELSSPYPADDPVLFFD